MTGGGSAAEHAAVAAEVFAKLPGAKPRQAEAPIAASSSSPPAGAEYLWNWFCQLSMGIAAGGFAPAVVTWESLQAWRNQMRLELDPWECVALVQLGQLRAVVQSEDLTKGK